MQPINESEPDLNDKRGRITVFALSLESRHPLSFEELGRPMGKLVVQGR